MDVSINDKGLFAFGPFRLDPTRRVLSRDGIPLKLPARLFDALLYLVENAGRLVEKDELLAAVWPGRIVEEGNLSQAISALRKVLHCEGEAAPMIVTVAGRGYRLAVQVRLESGASAFTLSPAELLVAAPARPATPEFWRPYRKALGVAALAATAACGVWLAARHNPPAPYDSAAFDPPPHSVAVLPFDNMSGDPGQAYFSDGLSEELINALSRVSGLQVAARMSSFSFKGTPATIGDIARRLNVGTVLEGSVRRQGARLRITAQLINARTGFQYWSRSYDRGQDDRLAVQADIASAVARSLQVTLLGEDTDKLRLGGTASAAAFDSYLRGMKLLRSGENKGFDAALAAFDQAVAADPGFARAYGGRAVALCNIALSTVSSDAAVVHRIFEQALASADRAVALAPDLAGAHAARAVVLDNGFLNPAAAEAEAARAVALEPGNAGVQGSFAQVALDVGRVDEGVAAAQRATSLDPLRPDAWDNLAYVLFEARRYDEAMGAMQHVTALIGSTPARSYNIIARMDLAKRDGAAAVRDCALGSVEEQDKCLAMAFHDTSQIDQAMAHLAKYRAANGDAGAFGFAEIYAHWGQPADAVHWLQSAFAQKDPTLEQMRADPLLDPIRDLPEFKDIEGRVEQGI
jgi:TolB-like protein/DNA-binding winged helix-turn-helix (wHTH) protein/Tfp pilus assembly protein PilF